MSSNWGCVLLANLDAPPISHTTLAASFAWLFDTTATAHIGSPIVAGSANWRRSSSSVVCLFDVQKAGRRFPGRAEPCPKTENRGFVQVFRPRSPYSYCAARPVLAAGRRGCDPAVARRRPLFASAAPKTGTDAHPLVQITLTAAFNRSRRSDDQPPCGREDNRNRLTQENLVPSPRNLVAIPAADSG